MTDASDDNKTEADKAKAEGNTLYKQRKFDEAIAQYEKLGICIKTSLI